MDAQMDLYHPCGFAVRLEDLPDYIIGVVTILRLFLCVASVLHCEWTGTTEG
jgi:hypothetical protein